MERRALLKMIAVLTGTVMIGGDVFLSGCSPEKSRGRIPVAFGKDDAGFLNEIAETILPETKSPGAKAANVGSFMMVMVNDCYNGDEQKVFHEGMIRLNEASEKMHGNLFMKATPEQRKMLLVELDKEAKDYQARKPALDESLRKQNKNFPGMPNHYFTMMKQLTLLGYFTSEQGCKEALRYIAIPGKYEGDVPYHKGDKAWA